MIDPADGTMPSPRRRRLGRGWLPLAAGAAMLAATALVWRSAHDREGQRIATRVEEAARSAADHLSARLQAVGDELDRNARRWNGLPTLSLTAARVESAILLRDPRIVEVLWLDVDLNGRWSFDAAGETEVRAAARWLEAIGERWHRGDHRALQLGPVLGGPGGDPVLLARVPVIVAAGLDGILLCLYDARETLRQAAEGLGNGFALRLRGPADETLLELDAAAAAPGWERPQVLALGELRLEIVAAPTSATLASLDSGLPRTVALGGIAFAFLLGLAVRVGQVEGARARAAAENAALQREIAARREAEAALARHTVELQRSNDDLSQFAHVISHDLRAPLNGIDMNLQRLAEEPAKDPARRVRGAREGVRRMVTMIDGLLDYARIGGSDEIEAVDAGQAAAEAITNLEAKVRECEADVRVEDLPVLRARRDQLVRLFQNLVGNALQHRGRATPRVTIRCEPQSAHWLFKVQDNGPGIAAEQAERIFSLFASDGGSSGIGLAICRRIVEGAGGRIWVRSEPDDGACFIFTWPRDRRDD